MLMEFENVSSEWAAEIDSDASLLIETGSSPREAVITAAKAVSERWRMRSIKQENRPAMRRHHLHFLP